MMDRSTLTSRVAAGESFEYVLFWGHTAKELESVGPWVLSQWFPSPFEVDGVTYATAEHFMMAAKAELFGDDEMRKRIIEADGPKKAKALGRKVKGFDEAVWREHRSQIVVRANRAKFAAHDDFAAYLCSTAPAVLVEASPYDRVWGIGMRKSDERALDPSQWKGSNLLGFALMQVRDELLENG